MRFSFSFLILFLCLISCKKQLLKTDTNNIKSKVISHRGAWKKLDLPQNSLASFRQAVQMEFAGSEFDVNMTSDDSLVITHGPKYHNLFVEKSTYKELLPYKLSNQEKIPTLQEFITSGSKNNISTLFICEIKQSTISPERSEIIAEKIYNVYKKNNALNNVIFISFGYKILTKLISLDKNIKTMYLGSNKTPEEMKKDGIYGVNYRIAALKKNPDWIEESKKNGLVLNSGTVNSIEDMDWLINKKFDYISTNEPELLTQRIQFLKNKTKEIKTQFANNSIIAHRGAWKKNELPKNSIASLKQAIKLQTLGSEFDVRITLDSVLVVTHDNKYNNLVVEKSTYKELSQTKLSNGETLPTLRNYLLAGLENNTTTSLVCEIKPTSSKEKNLLVANKTLALVKELKADKIISSYISFSFDILEAIIEENPNVKTQYLAGSKSPLELKEAGISGLDYHVSIFKKQTDWIVKAKELGLTLNAWTVNKAEDIDWLLANDFDYITTDEPELALEKFNNFPVVRDYKLVWSDEFNYSGKPDSLKWKHEIGFKRNEEKQYYTDSLKNSRVEKGFLILESHKEKIANLTFKSVEDTNWRNNQKYGEYTSASLTTSGLAEWTYGRIDIRAKLPKGVGLWPAFWMLGENQSEVGWPKCGEIDIMEHVGFDPDSIFGTIHTKAYNHMIGTQRGKSIKIEKPYESFHTYSIIWTPESIDFLLDNEVYNHIENDHKTTDEWPFDQNFHIKINTAIGGMLGGRKGIDDAIFPQQLVIDYVRVYQKNQK